MKALIIGLQLDEIDLDSDDAVDKIMSEFDKSGNSAIEEDEFVDGISKWIDEAKRSVQFTGSYTKRFITDFHSVSLHFVSVSAKLSCCD